MAFEGNQTPNADKNTPATVETTPPFVGCITSDDTPSERAWFALVLLRIG